MVGASSPDLDQQMRPGGMRLKTSNASAGAAEVDDAWPPAEGLDPNYLRPAFRKLTVNMLKPEDIVRSPIGVELSLATRPSILRGKVA